MSADERARQRRSKLLEATLAVWTDPERNTTMTAICNEAGLTERYFYESFANLDDARRALLESIAGEIESATRRAAEEADAAGADAVQRTRAAIRAFVDLLVADPRKGRAAIIEAGGVPALRGRRTELLREFAHATAAEAQVLPERSTSDGEIAGLLFIGGMAELVTAWLDGAVQATPAEIVDTATRTLLGLHA
ncbi:TetR/AcrR family transcriptional regulator [Nocardioides sp. BGMRC 2183]|nr:TetR/AcrR family transcriptional regulator [Nocardioides sp. BGMRC 2183]